MTQAIPTTVAELEELLTDSAKLQASFGDGTFAEIVRNYAKATISKDPDHAAQLRDAVQSGLREFLVENHAADIVRPNLGPAKGVNRPPANKLYNKAALGVSIDGAYDSIGEVCYDIWHLHDRAGNAELNAKLTRLRNAFSSTVPSEGGFLIPETVRAELLSVALENAVIRPRARVIPMESLRVPFPMIDSTSNVSSVYGGIVGYWTPEAGALTTSSATFGRVTLEARKLTAYAELPNELIQDSPISMQAFLDQVFPKALGFYEDDGFINGSGVDMPLGIVKADALVSVTKEVGQPAATIVWENIVKMYARMLPTSLGDAVWLASIDTFPELATMALSVGTGGSAIWINNGQVGPPMTILGRPVYFTEKLAKLGTVCDIMFVDLGYYLIGDRMAMSAMSSPHIKFQNDMTAYRLIERVDGRPWIQSAITPRNNANALSPYVAVATRA